MVDNIYFRPTVMTLISNEKSAINYCKSVGFLHHCFSLFSR